MCIYPPRLSTTPSYAMRCFNCACSNSKDVGKPKGHQVHKLVYAYLYRVMSAAPAIHYVHSASACAPGMCSREL